MSGKEPSTVTRDAVGLAQDPIWAARVDIAAAMNLAVVNDLHEGIDNHFTVKVPGREDQFLLAPHGIHWSEVEPEDLLIIDEHGERVLGRGYFDPSAHWIHWPIHQSRPTAKCVLHTHMPYAAALCSVTGGRLEMIHQNAMRFHGRIAYDDEFNGLVFGLDEGRRIADALGSADILFMANHGVMVVGNSVAQAFHDLYFLERACMVQVLAQSTGLPLRVVGDEQAAITRAQYQDIDVTAADRHFRALRRVMERNRR